MSRVLDLDRGHAQRPGGLQVGADVVEEDGFAGLDSKRVEGDPIDLDLRLAVSDHRRLHDHVETGLQVHVGERRPVVGQGRHPETLGADGGHRIQHARAGYGHRIDSAHEVPCVDERSSRPALVVELRAECVEVQVTSFVPGPSAA